MSLTPKQEKFCLAYLETGSQSEAYRIAYDVAVMTQSAVYVEACRLLDNPKIAQRLSDLREPIMARHAITVDTLLAELEEARKIALSCETPQSSAAVGATMGKAKLLGLDKQLVEVTGANGGPLQSETIIKVDEATLATLLDRL